MSSLRNAVSTLRYSLRSRAVRQGLWALLAAALGCLLIVLAWWGPARREQMQLTSQLDAHRSTRVQAERLQQATRAQQQVLPAVEMLEKKLQVQAAQADLVQGIARLAARRGVRVASQAFDEGRPQPGAAQALYLELGLLGDYAALRRLMGDLVTLPMWIEVVEERLELAGQGGALVKAQWRLLTYRSSKEPS